MAGSKLNLNKYIFSMSLLLPLFVGLFVIVVVVNDDDDDSDDGSVWFGL